MKLHSRWAVMARAGLFLAGAASAHAGTYYVDAVNGNDGNPGTQTYPWQNLSQVNMAALAQSDVVLFANGQEWHGTLQLKDKVIYSNYSSTLAPSAVKPVIRGSVPVGGLTWSQLPGTAIYFADVTSVLPAQYTDVFNVIVVPRIGQLFLNGTRMQRARHPNVGAGFFQKGKNGYLPVDSVGTTACSTTPPVSSTALDPDSGYCIEAPAYTRRRMKMRAGDLTNADLTGAEAYVRKDPWLISHADIVAQDASDNSWLTVVEQHNLSDTAQDSSTAKSHIRQGYGYWLENKLWMLDQPGEWVFDAAAKRLYVRMSDDLSPQGKNLRAAVLSHAALGKDVTDARITNLVFKETRGDAILISGLANTSARVRLEDVEVKGAGDVGIKVVGVQSSSTARSMIARVLVEDSVGTGIHTVFSGLVDVWDSTVNRAGMGYGGSALHLGPGSDTRRNVINQASNAGIIAGKNSEILLNVVTDACKEMNDCGALYVRGGEDKVDDTSVYNVGTTFSRNHALFPTFANPSDNDRLDGTPLTDSSAVGIYLDDFASGGVAEHNVVRHGDFGVMVHAGRNNFINGNALGGNRRAQVWISEDKSPKRKSDGTYYNRDFSQGNLVDDNVMATMTPEATLIRLDSALDSTSDLGTFSNNRYAQYADPVFKDDQISARTFVDDRLGATVKFWMFGQWKASGKDTGSTLHRTVSVTAQPSANLLNNGGFDASLGGWTHYLSTGLQSVPNCLASTGSGACMSTSPNATALSATPVKHIVYTNWITQPIQPLSIQLDHRYMASVDARAEAAGNSIGIVTRSTTGPNYNPVGFPQVWRDLQTGWARFQGMIKGTATGAARFDMDLIGPAKVYLDNARIVDFGVPASWTATNAQPIMLVNSTNSSASFACPAVDPSLCGSYIDVYQQIPVTFPLSIPFRSARVVAPGVARLVDADLDGLPGDGDPAGMDQCANTAAGLATNHLGCGR